MMMNNTFLQHINDRVPKQITPPLVEFAKQLTENAPFFVPINSPPGNVPNQCHTQAAAIAAEQGGEWVIGWSLWDCGGLYLRAVCHSVVRFGDNYTDPTPDEDGANRRLFVVDSFATNTARYFVLVDDPIVHSFIECNDRICKAGPNIKTALELRGLTVDLCRLWERLNGPPRLQVGRQHKRRSERQKNKQQRQAIRKNRARK